MLFPDEEPGCIVPPGKVDKVFDGFASPPFQRWDKRRSIVPPVPGTAEALSEDVFHPTLQDWIWKKACFPTTVNGNQGT